MVHKSVKASKKQQILQKQSEIMVAKRAAKLDEKNRIKQQKILEELVDKVRQLPEEIILEIYMWCQKPQYFFLTKKINNPEFTKYYDQTTARFSIIEDSPRSFSFHTKNSHYYGELDNISRDREILFLEYCSKDAYRSQIIKHSNLVHKLTSI